MKRAAGPIVAFAITLASLVHAHAQTSVESFYKGRTVSILIAYPPGGSYDTYARLAAQFMGKYIPGHPTIIVQNKSGGAATLQTFIKNSPDNGTAMGIFPETIGLIQLTDPVTGKWDVHDLTYIGSFAGVNNAFIIRKDAPAKTIEDLKTTKTNVGCNSPISQAYTNPALLKNLAGFKFNIICGYSGQNEFPVAMMRGEIDMTSGAWNGWKTNAGIVNGDFKVIIQGGLKRHKDLADVPLMQELVADSDKKKIIEFWSAGAAIGRALTVRSSTPADRISALRTAFDQAMKDPDLLAQAAKINIEIDPTPGDDVQKVSLGILDTPKRIIDLAIDAAK